MDIFKSTPILYLWVKQSTLTCTSGNVLETNISRTKALLKMIFVLPRWDLFVPWRVTLSRHEHWECSKFIGIPKRTRGVGVNVCIDRQSSELMSSQQKETEPDQRGVMSIRRQSKQCTIDYCIHADLWIIPKILRPKIQKRWVFFPWNATVRQRSNKSPQVTIMSSWNFWNFLRGRIASQGQGRQVYPNFLEKKSPVFDRSFLRREIFCVGVSFIREFPVKKKRWDLGYLVACTHGVPMGFQLIWKCFGGLFPFSL